MRIRNRMLPASAVVFREFPPRRKAEMQLSRFVAMMRRAGNGEMEKA
jgi:hypothetical protein